MLQFFVGVFVGTMLGIIMAALAGGSSFDDGYNQALHDVLKMFEEVEDDFVQ